MDDGSATVTVGDVMGPIVLLSTTSMEHEDLDLVLSSRSWGSVTAAEGYCYSEPATRGAAAPAGRTGLEV